MARILVAGATGYLGGFVLRELAARGHGVRALTRSRGKLDQLREATEDVVEAEITRPDTLTGLCDGVEVVFSSVGLTRQRDGLAFRDVDYRGNLNLLEAARRSGVRKFVYVSVFNGPLLRHLDIVAAHEDFVDELRSCGMEYSVLRPTGYFSDLSEVFEMARKGRVYLIGRGENRVNPIHGADLAAVCADAIDGPQAEIDVGGPEVLTWRAIAETAFAALERRPRITRIPAWMLWSVVRPVRLFNRHLGELMAFFTTMATSDVVAPATGSHTLAAHFRRLAGAR